MSAIKKYFVLPVIFLSILVGSLVVIGWFINMEELKNFTPSFPPMKFSSAICFVLLGIFLWQYLFREKSSLLISGILATIVFLFAAISFSESVFHFNAHIDSHLVPGQIVADSGSDLNRMGILVAFCFLVFVLASLIIKAKKPLLQTLAQYAFHGITLISFIALLGYLFDVPYFYRVTELSTISLPSALLFLLLSIAATLYKPTLGLTGLLTGQSMGSKMAGKIFPLTTTSILILGALRLSAHKYHLVGVEFGIALFCISFIVVSLAIIKYTSVQLNKLEAVRLKTDDSLVLLNLELEQKVKDRTQALKDVSTRLVMATKGSGIGIFDWELATDKLLWDEQMFRLYGLNPMDFKGTVAVWENSLAPGEMERCRELITIALEKERELDIEFKILWPDETIRYIKCRAYIERDSLGKALRIIGTNWEITQHKKQLEAIRQSEERYQKMISGVQDHSIILLDKQGTIENWNSGAVKINGYQEEEVLHAGLGIFYTADDQKKNLPIQLLDTARKNGSAYEEGWRVRKDGSMYEASVVLTSLYNDEKEVVGFTKITRDLTEVKKAEELVKVNEAKLRLVLSAVGDNVWEMNLRTQQTFLSDAFFTLVGYHNTTEWQTENLWRDCIHTADIAMFEENQQKYRNGEIDKHSIEYRILHKNGQIRWILDRGALIEKDEHNNPVKIVGTHTDITKRKLLEEELQTEKEKYSIIFNGASQFMALLSVDGILLEVNETALQMGGSNREYLLGKLFWELPACSISPDVFKQSIEAARLGVMVRSNVEVLSWEGMTVWIDQTIKPVYNENKEVVQLIAEGRDISMQVGLEKINKEQQEQIKLFVKHTPAAVAMFDKQMNYIVASSRWNNVLQIEEKNLTGKSHDDVFPEFKQRPEWQTIIAKCMQGHVETNDERSFQWRYGKVGWVNWAIHPWRKNDNKVGGLIIFIEDVTDKVLAREKLQKTNEQLLNSNSELEQFAYIASHDLQEPLRMVSSFLQLLQKKYAKQLDTAANEYIGFAVDGAERMKALIRDLLAFSRVGTDTDEWQEMDVNNIIHEAKAMLQSAIKESDATIVVTSKLPVIKGNELQMKMIFQNLLSNSLKYMGTDKPYIELGHVETEDQWEFYVKDNGIGIDPKYFEKIFVVFQRLHTKTDYPGTGIGLSICKKIAEKHGGTIWLESTPDKGSNFHFSIKKNITT